MQKNDLKLIEVDLDDLIPYDNNPRVNDHAVAAVAESIRQCGYINPIIIDPDYVVLAGHTRLKALKQAGVKKAEVLLCEGLSESQGRKFRLLDNKTNEKAKWNFKALRDETAGLDFGFDFGIDALLTAGDNLQVAAEKQEMQNKETTPAAGSDKKLCTCPRCGREFIDGN